MQPLAQQLSAPQLQNATLARASACAQQVASARRGTSSREPRRIRASAEDQAVTTATPAADRKVQARLWIESWRDRTQSSVATAPASSDIDGRREAVRQWIHAWRARSLERTLHAQAQAQGVGNAAAPRGGRDVAALAEQGGGCSTQSAVHSDTAALAEQSGGCSTQSAVHSDTAALVEQVGRWSLSLSALYAADMAVAEACDRLGVGLPAPLVGMFALVALLLALDQAAPDAAAALYRFFAPGTNWTARWLPLFYTPSLVVLPLSIQRVEASDLAVLLLLVCSGMVASLAFTAQAAMTIRGVTNTQLQPVPPAPPAEPFVASHYAAWGAILAASLAATPVLGGEATALPAGLAATVCGYMWGTALPAGMRGVLHPVLVCAAVGSMGVAGHGALAGWAYDDALHAFLAKGAGPTGAGDVLYSFLGVVIISFGFKIYSQRTVLARHAPEILGSTLGLALFSLFGTAAAAHALGLSPDLARAVVPRGTTLALAIPIAQQLDVPDVSITAMAVVVTGLFGANFCQRLLDAFGFKGDPIARGLAAAGSSHGLGAAALAAKEPEALPFCALGYSLTGIFCSVLASVPAVRHALLALTG